MKNITNHNSARVYSLAEYIDKYFNGNQRKFAEAQGVKPPQVTQWLNADFIVVDDVLYSQRRQLDQAT
jgi:hypothetical protein